MVGQWTVPVRLELPDPEFMTAPAVFLLDRPGPLANPQPHISLDGGLCYLDGKLAVLDPYDPLGMLGTCLAKVHDLLADLIAGRGKADLVREFPAMWFPERVMLVDLPAGFSGKAELRSYRSHSGGGINCIAVSGESATVLAKTCLGGDAQLEGSCPVRVVTVQGPVVAEGALWPPKTAQQFRAWLSGVSPDGVAQIDQDVVPKRKGDRTRAVVIMSPNGMVGALIDIPSPLDTQEFRNRRRPIIRAFQDPAASWPLTRFGCIRADRQHIYSRSLGDGMVTLEGKKILLVGCGTIGGFLADLLAKVGAGAGGRFMLVDPDLLMPENIGRHLLGLPDLMKHKAEGCSNHLKHKMGDILVEAFPYEVQRLRNTFESYDFIIDATGEEPLSLWLNQRRVDALRGGKRFPPILHVWLHGAGSAAVGFLNTWPEGACYKCLRPEYGKAWRHDPLKDGTDPGKVVLQACGDGTHIRYPVSASTQASALALEMTLDWSRGTPGPILRSRQIDREVARASFDRQPALSENCPACRPR